MRILTKKHYFFAVFLLLNSKNVVLVASDLTPILKLSTDIKRRLIIESTSPFHDEKKYIMEDYKAKEYIEDLFIPCTIRTINLVKAAKTSPAPAAKPDDDCLLDVQLWDTNHPNYVTNADRRFRLHKESQNIDHVFFIDDLQNVQTQFFDGMNSNDSAVLAQAGSKSFSIYFITANDQRRMHPLYHPIYQNADWLRSIMLHPKEDKIVFSTQHFNKEHEKTPFKLTIADVLSKNNEHIFAINTEIYLNFLIQKTISLGNQTYLALTDEGKLVILWQNKHGQIQYALQTHESTFVDIAVDNAVTNKDGLHPHIACLNIKGDLFVCNLLAFSQPTLFFIKNICFLNLRPFRLFHDNGQCGILYITPNNTNEPRKYADFIVWSDNLNTINVAFILRLTKEYIASLLLK